MEKLRILFTNNSLGTRAGTEMALLDLATEFRRRGHLPVAYTRGTHGEMAEALRKACIPVIANLNALGAVPDIIHGQHHIEAMSAMLHFPTVPAIYACHGWLPWQESPPRFFSIQKYVAVGELTRESIVTCCNVPPDDVEIIPNAVDLQKFRLKPSAAARPRSAVIFDNHVTEDSGYAQTVRLACERAGIERIDIIGSGAKNSVADPEHRIATYDLVFAVGRSAVEAMCVGCAVIIANPLGAYGLIDPSNVESLFGRFGLSSQTEDRLDTDFLHAEILKYRPEDAMAVARFIRDRVDLRLAADRYEAIYREAIIAWKKRVPTAEVLQEQLRQAAQYVASIKPLIRQDQLKQEILKRRSLLSQLKNKGIRIRSTG